MSFVTSQFERAVNTVRILSIDAIQKANSGHPGMPMGCADFALTLWHRHLRHNPKNPLWSGRDRFVLSAGHGSMLLYSLLHLYGYEDVTMEQIKQFRQLGSKTPGHPEYGQTCGVEISTGPLGSGLASAVGMAVAAKQLVAQTGCTLYDEQKIYVIAGDGCLMEGVSHEACAMAGHLKLNNLILFYDSNDITIEGSVSLTSSLNEAERFRSYGWKVIEIDGQSPEACDQALTEARTSKDQPVIIIGKTTIGYGSCSKAGKSDCHGAPLGADDVAATKVKFGFDPEQSFVVEDEVYAMCQARVAELEAAAAEWENRFAQWKQENAQGAALLQCLFEKKIPADLTASLLNAMPEKKDATRSHNGICIQKIAEVVPAFCGGSADLGSSCKTVIKGEPQLTAENYAGRNIQFGIREMAMGLVANGMALYGNAIPFVSTFMVFSDYMKPALRLAALQNLKVIFVFTHDSIYVGEDGPTHQPIEHLAMLRSIPNMTVIRPADAGESAKAWAEALKVSGPVCLVFTRQNVDNLPAEVTASGDLSKGAYVVEDEADAAYALVATGSEVTLACKAAKTLREFGYKVRVVSMPSCELFDAQSAEYKASVLPESMTIISIEAALTYPWYKYTGRKGLCIGIDCFGVSAPGGEVAKYFGIVEDAVVAKIKETYPL